MIDFKDKLSSLKARRQGTKVLNSFEIGINNLTNTSWNDSSKEFYEELNDSDSIKYLVGACAAVDAKYTEISFREGRRVATLLQKTLEDFDEYVDIEFQGSVPLNIHIKGYSDVDVLLINRETLSIEPSPYSEKLYQPPIDNRTIVEILKHIRFKSEVLLPKLYPKADVDISGKKSISISGGSLQRKVDLVPASWFDNKAYQISQKKADRGINIFNKPHTSLETNYPFKHMQLVNDLDKVSNGNLKKLIRLLKNIKEDMPREDKKVAKLLSSFDLTAICYHMNKQLLVGTEIFNLIERLLIHLNILIDDPLLANKLMVPDRTRYIFNDPDKFRALKVYQKHVDELVRDIFLELGFASRQVKVAF